MRSSSSRFAGRPADFGKGRGIGHDMISGERDHDGIAAAPLRVAGAGDNCRSGITPHRFEQDIGLGADRRQLLGDQKPILPIGDDDRATKQRRIGNAADGLLKGRMRPEQRQKLLGAIFTRRRPQPGTGAAAHDEGNDRSSQIYTPINSHRMASIEIRSSRILRDRLSAARATLTPRDGRQMAKSRSLVVRRQVRMSAGARSCPP